MGLLGQVLCMCRAAKGEHPANPDPKAASGPSQAERLEAELVRWLRNAQQVRGALHAAISPSRDVSIRPSVQLIRRSGRPGLPA